MAKATPADNEDSSRIWVKKNKPIVIAIVFVALFVLSCLVFLAAVISDRYGSSGEQETGLVHGPNICSNPVCLKEALQITQQINPDVDPCNDFHGFVCGNIWKRFLGKKGLEEELKDEMYEEMAILYKNPGSYDNHTIVKTAKTLYNNCIHQTNWEIYRLNLHLIKSDIWYNWPMLQGNNWDKRKFDWLEETYKFRELGVPHSIFFGVSIEVHPQNKTQQIFQVTLPSIDLLEREVMMKIAHHLKLNQDKIYLEDIELLFTWKEYFTNQNLDHLETSNEHNIYRVSEYQKMQQQYNPNINFNWLRFINTILSPATQIIQSDFLIFPNLRQVLHRLNALMTTSRRSQANYMMWRLIEATAPILVSDLQLKHQFGEDVKVKEREKQCIDFIQKRFAPSPIDILFVNKYLSPENVNLLNEIAINIKTGVLEVLQKADWLDVNDKITSIQKLKKMTMLMGVTKNFPRDQLLNDLDKAADMEEIYGFNNFVCLILQMEKNYQTFWYKRIHETVFQWNFDTASRHIENNVLEIPAYMLRGVMFNENRPNFFNYGYLGHRLGHYQISYLFLKKSKGVRFYTTWSNNTVQAVQGKINCVRKTLDNYYEKYDLNLLNFYIWRYNLAAKASYLAYKSLQKNEDNIRLFTVNYTGSQLYWINVASLWCDRRSFRELPLGTLNYMSFGLSSLGHNNLNFAIDFNCSVRSQMYPFKNCGIL